MNRPLSLLISWCDGLLVHQVKNMPDPLVNGGFLCPACGMVHGRSADSVLMLLCAYRYSGDRKYYDAANAVLSWAEQNVLRPDGSYYNDLHSDWKGITVFSCVTMGECLLYFSEELEDQDRERWMTIFRRQADFVLEKVRKLNPVVNYRTGPAFAMALAWKLTGEEKYRKEAEIRLAEARQYVTENKLLFGEGYPFDKTPKGCLPIDVGYNVEESLPALICASELMEDAHSLDLAVDSMRAHLEFMLPDGGWDNSWGSRHNKWTYWGSRTSDGCQVGLCRILDKDPIFADAAWRNFELYERCTHNGLFYGGPMYYENGERACLHHAFAHGKALCSMLLAGLIQPPEKTVLPREKKYGLKEFPEAHVHMISLGGWKATVSDTDYVYCRGAANGGGALNLLWHDKVGMLAAATMNAYWPVEPYNFQYPTHRDAPFLSLTPRIIAGSFTNVNDKTTVVKTRVENGEVILHVTGTLTDDSFKQNGTQFELEYRFASDCLVISALTSEDADFLLPLVATRKDTVRVGGDSAEIKGNNKHITVKTDGEITSDCPENDREINMVGGFLTTPLRIRLEKGRRRDIRIRVSDKN